MKVISETAWANIEYQESKQRREKIILTLTKHSLNGLQNLNFQRLRTCRAK
jgi:hypothetical protein